MMLWTLCFTGEGKAGFAANDPEAEDHPVDDVYGDVRMSILEVKCVG